MGHSLITYVTGKTERGKEKEKEKENILEPSDTRTMENAISNLHLKDPERRGLIASLPQLPPAAASIVAIASRRGNQTRHAAEHLFALAVIANTAEAADARPDLGVAGYRIEAVGVVAFAVLACAGHVGEGLSDGG